MQEPSNILRYRGEARRAGDRYPSAHAQPAPHEVTWPEPDIEDRDLWATYNEDDITARTQIPDAVLSRLPPVANENTRMSGPARVGGVMALALTAAVGLAGVAYLILEGPSLADATVRYPVSEATQPSHSPPPVLVEQVAGQPAAQIPASAEGNLKRTDPVQTAAVSPVQSAPAKPVQVTVIAPSQPVMEPEATRTQLAALATAPSSPVPPAAQPQDQRIAASVDTPSDPNASRDFDVTFSAAAPQPPAPAKKPAVRVVTPGEASAHLARAASLLEAGQVTAARSILLLLAEQGHREAAYRYAQTYDPKKLEALGIIGVRADPEIARRYYTLAATAGHREAQRALASQ